MMFTQSLFVKGLVGLVEQARVITGGRWSSVYMIVLEQEMTETSAEGIDPFEELATKLRGEGKLRSNMIQSDHIRHVFERIIQAIASGCSTYDDWQRMVERNRGIRIDPAEKGRQLHSKFQRPDYRDVETWARRTTLLPRSGLW